MHNNKLTTSAVSNGDNELRKVSDETVRYAVVRVMALV